MLRGYYYSALKSSGNFKGLTNDARLDLSSLLNQANLEQLWPQFPCYEDTVALGVVSNAIQHVSTPTSVIGGKQSG